VPLLARFSLLMQATTSWERDPARAVGRSIDTRSAEAVGAMNRLLRLVRVFRYSR